MERLLGWYVGWLRLLAGLEARLRPPGAAERGQGILEYCLIIGLIAVAIIAVLSQFTTAISAVFTRLIGRLAGIG
jgi:Flp pilus assembly pilin Flp